MAAPIPANVRLTDDAPATGKYIEAQSETISGVTQLAHRTTPRHELNPVGIYDAQSDILAISATAQDAVASGHLWLQNPTAATKHARLRRVEMRFVPTTVTARIPAAGSRLAIARFTFTGTATGTAIVVSKKRSTASSGSTPLIAADATNGANLRIAVTGMTVTLGGLIWSAFIPPTLTGVGWATSQPAIWEPRHERDYVVLAPGEGIVFYQPEAGATADDRRGTVTATWDEVDAS